MERRDARTRFYSPKAVPRKERRDWTRIPIGDINGRKSELRRGKEEDALTGGAMVSATARETDARTRKLGQRPDSLGSAQAAKRGGSESRPRRNGPRVMKQRPHAAGERVSRGRRASGRAGGLLGRKLRREVNSLFFFL
jgi:hypothetical protein